MSWITGSRLRVALVSVGGTVIVIGLIATVIKWAPHWLASTGGLNPDQRASEIGRVRTALLAVLAGSIAVVGAIYTSRTFALNRQGQITERFTRAVDQLGNKDSLDVRVGGIYALERLARESREDHGPIVEILTAYVREHAPRPNGAEKSPGGVHEDPAAGPRRPDEPAAVTDRPTTDVQAALTVLGRRRRQFDTDRPLDLGRTHLAGADLTGASLQEAQLWGANLHGANLYAAHLQEATVVEANIQKAILMWASLQEAYLDKASLEEANLWGAKLQGASLCGAKLQGAILTMAKLEGVRYDRETTWPEGFEPSAHGAVLSGEDDAVSDAPTPRTVG